MDTLKLGHIIEEGRIAQRDATHIAVAPVTAHFVLRPGEHVGVSPDGSTTYENPVGIIDPFLLHSIEPGTRCWLYLYPGSITSLAHQWTHPAFTEQPKCVAPDKEASEAWLRAFISTADCPDYDTVMSAIQGEFGEEGGRFDGEALFFRDRDAHSDIPREFWDHVEIVIGERVAHRPEYFSCSC